MKRRDFVSELVDAGCCLKRHGVKHDIYINHENGKQSPVPGHSEIKESLFLKN